MASLPESRLYTFIDQDKKFALYFLEGQKLIHDLVVTQNLKPGEFDFFRSAVLGVQPMIAYLKTGELFCVYVDSQSPYFRLKIEMNAMGLMRGMIYSEALRGTPEAVTGNLRLLKILPGSKTPYESIVGLDGISMDEIINNVLSRSYQVASKVFVSGRSDQSVMASQLPLTQKEETIDPETAFARYAGDLNRIMEKGLTDEETLCAEMGRLGFSFLGAQPVAFRCGCSKEMMTENIRRLVKSASEDIFVPGQDAIEVVCEYCKTPYQISRRDTGEKPAH